MNNKWIEKMVYYLGHDNNWRNSAILKSISYFFNTQDFKMKLFNKENGVISTEPDKKTRSSCNRL